MTTLPSKPKRLYLLLAICGAVALILVARLHFGSNPTDPPRYADVAEKLRFYSRRIKTNPEDKHAYVELGKLEEGHEFYFSALRRLYIARALGAPERDIALPIGRSLSHLARWDEARAELTKALQLMPDSVEAAANLAGVYNNSGNPGLASQTLNDFVARHRAAGGGLALGTDDIRRLMLCYAEARDSAKAGEMAEAILRVDPNDAGAYSIAGHARVLAGRYREALPFLEKASKLDPNTAELCYQYGTTLEQLGRENEALAQYQRCVLLNPNALDAFLALASIYEKRKDWKLASVAISNAALHGKHSVKVLYRAGKLNEKAGNKWDALYWFSNAALEAAKYPEALGYATKLSAAPDPTWHVSGLLNMADAYHGMHRMKEYLSTVKQVASHDTPQDNMRLADAYEKADLLETQVEYLKRALAKEPKLAPEVHNSIAATMLRRGLKDEAEREMLLAIEADPKNPDLHTQLGRIYLERRDVGDRARKAVSEFEQAVRLAPEEASSYQNLGIAYAAANDPGRAAANLKHAIDLQPGYGPSYEELGRVYAKMGDRESSNMMLSLYHRYVRFDQNLKTLVARADQNKTDPAAQVELADVLYRSGDYGSALDRYVLALKLKPNDASAQRKYHQLLQTLTQSKASQAKKQQ